MQTIRRDRCLDWIMGWRKLIWVTLLNMCHIVINHISDPLRIVIDWGVHGAEARSTASNAEADDADLPLDGLAIDPSRFDQWSARVTLARILAAFNSDNSI